MKKQINPTIKAHLIRSAFYLLLLIAVCAIPFALAQRNKLIKPKRSATKAPPTKAQIAAASGKVLQSGAPGAQPGEPPRLQSSLAFTKPFQSLTRTRGFFLTMFAVLHPCLGRRRFPCATLALLTRMRSGFRDRRKLGRWFFTINMTMRQA